MPANLSGSHNSATRCLSVEYNDADAHACFAYLHNANNTAAALTAGYTISYSGAVARRRCATPDHGNAAVKCTADITAQGVRSTMRVVPLSYEMKVGSSSATLTRDPVALSPPPNVSPTKHIELVDESLTLLFHCEYLVLVEYIECVISLLYATYLMELFQLPKAQYYPHTRAMTANRLRATVFNLLEYIWLEVISLLGLHYVLKRTFGFSPVYLLAFMLEWQAQQLQGQLFVWIVYILQFMLQHCDLGKPLDS